MQVSIRHLSDAQRVEHLVVGGCLEALEFVNGDLSVVDRDKVDQLLVILDVDVQLLNGGSVGVDIFLDSGLGFEEALEGGLAQHHLLELLLLVALLALSLRRENFEVTATIDSLFHRLEVEQLTTEHHPGLLERIAPFFDVFGDLHWQVIGDWVREDALRAVAVRVSLDCHVFERHQVQVDLLVVLMRRVPVGCELAERLGLFLERAEGAVKELLKVRDFLFVDEHLALCLVLLKREI